MSAHVVNKYYHFLEKSDKRYYLQKNNKELNMGESARGKGPS